MEAVIVALVVGLLAIGGQELRERTRARTLRESKEEDWRREDEVASRALEASHVLERKLDVIDEGQQVIHTLVNQEKTEGLKLVLHLRKLNMEQLRAAGQKVPDEDIKAIEEVEKELADRENQLVKAKEQMRMQKEGE